MRTISWWQILLSAVFVMTVFGVLSFYVFPIFSLQLQTVLVAPADDQTAQTTQSIVTWGGLKVQNIGINALAAVLIGPMLSDLPGFWSWIWSLMPWTEVRRAQKRAKLMQREENYARR